MKKNILFFINIMLFVILAGLLFLSMKGPARQVKAPAQKIAPKETAYQEASYSIPETAHDETAAQGRKPESLNDVYAMYPEKDVGDNMMTTWNTIKPEDKKKLGQVIDKDISETKEALKARPEDKKLKNKLFISETMKKLMAGDFKYKFKQND